MLGHFILGLWSPKERTLFINLRELRAIRLGLLHFRHLIVGLNIGVFSDNTTALSYICKQGGTVSSPLSQEAQLLLRWAESSSVVGSSVREGLWECRGGFLERTEPGRRIGVDSPPGCSQRSLVEVASDGRSVRNIAESPSSCILFSHQQSDDSRLQCVSPVVGRHASLCLPTVCAGQGSPQQGRFISESYVNSGGSLMAPERVVPKPS